MAHVNNSIIAGKLRGILGKEIVFRQWAGKTIVAKAPKKRKGDPTPGQAEMLEKFMLASRYAKAVLKNPGSGMAEAYAAVLLPRQNVYSRAIGDFMSSPIVKSIDTNHYHGATGDSIAIRATDDFRVVSVRVDIYAPDGTLLEKGNAEQNINGIDWTYTITLANPQVTGTKIKAIATDVPGNEGMLEVSL